VSTTSLHQAFHKGVIVLYTNLLNCKSNIFSDFSLSVNAPWLRISVIHKSLQVSFMGWACEVYTIARGQCEHILLCSALLSICEICVVLCVPYNLFIFNMKQNHYTEELKKKHQIMLHSSITGSMKVILGSERNKRSDCTRHRQWHFVARWL
jgi:hypothetical protein